MSKTALGCALLSVWLLTACDGKSGGESPSSAPQRAETVHHVRLKHASPAAIALAEKTWAAASRQCPKLAAKKPSHELFQQWEDIYYGPGATAVHTTSQLFTPLLANAATPGVYSCEVLEEKVHRIALHTPAGSCHYKVMTGSGGDAANGDGCGKAFDVFAAAPNQRSSSVRDTGRTLALGGEECKVFEDRVDDIDGQMLMEECVQPRDDVFVGELHGGIGGLLLTARGVGQEGHEMRLEKIERDRKLPDLHRIFPRSVADLPKP
ncbi:hypothetical protein [Roseateles oligotrophus]|uniref:hypothetical protein n=1 Tax=Roseateles oligotrophus TaxID=1769250 RepID=UPI00161AD671|nr:hypothetical protein [Roseateles oligotrophus]